MKSEPYEFGVPEFDSSMLTTKGNVFRKGRAPLRTEVINEISGVEFDNAFSNREPIEPEDQLCIPVISVDDLSKINLPPGEPEIRPT